MAWPGKIAKYGLILLLVGALVGALAAVAGYFYFRKDLPSVDNLRTVQLQVPLRVYSADGKLIAQYGEKRRYPVRYDEIPPRLVQAFLAAEDANFFSHRGIDPVGLARAALTLITTGEKRQGGSTITMQVARNFYLSRQRTFTRKIREIILALHIEQELSKEEILELYLNKIYLGHRAYGVAAAAEVYYGKSLDQLDLPQIAMIAGLPKAPSRYNPITNPSRARERRDYVLRRMRELGYITQQEARAAMEAPVTASLHGADIEVEAPYLAEMVREKMVRDYGDAAYTGGFVVHTTVTSKLQAAANRALRAALVAYDRRHGWRGPERHIDPVPASAEERRKLLQKIPAVGDLLPALVTSVGEKTVTVEVRGKGEQTIPWEGLKWARPYLSVDKRGPAPKKASQVVEVGDLVRVQHWTEEQKKKKGKKGGQEEAPVKSYWRLAQVPEVSGALVSLDPGNGAILALVGGYDFHASKFNRVTQAKRQPGSGFKAVIYSAALDAGFTAASIINDAPVVIEDDGSGDSWRPENYSGKFFGPTRLRLALTKSRNLVSIRLLRSMGIQHALEHARRFGFDPEKLPHGLSLALGSGEVTPLQMARAYAVLANGGYLVEPWFIQRIERNGETIFQADPLVAGCDPEKDRCRPAPRTLDEENRYLMYSMMQDVIRHGTGWRARELGRKDLAGKTGTTNDQRDAWFNGYNQHIVTVAWVGFDDNRTLGKKEVGGRVALPAWMAFMKVALEDIPDDPPKMPSSLVVARIDKATGLRVSGHRPDSMFEIFRPDNLPPMLEEKRPEPFTPTAGKKGGTQENEELF